MKKPPHKHSYTDLKMFRLLEVQKDYNGTTGDKAILTRACSCGTEKAFEMGKYKDMVALYESLSKQQGGSV